MENCPNSEFCENSGGFPNQIGEDEWVEIQCEGCYTNPNSIFNKQRERKSMDKKMISIPESLMDTLQDYLWEIKQSGISKMITLSAENLRDQLMEVERETLKMDPEDERQHTPEHKQIKNDPSPGHIIKNVIIDGMKIPDYPPKNTPN